MRDDPYLTIRAIDEAIRKTQALGLIDIAIILTPQDHDDVMIAKAAIAEARADGRQLNGNIYRGYRLVRNHLMASQVLGRTNDGGWSGWAVSDWGMR